MKVRIKEVENSNHWETWEEELEEGKSRKDQTE